MNNPTLELLLKRQGAMINVLSLLMKDLSAGGKVQGATYEQAHLLLKEALALEKQSFTAPTTPRGRKPSALFLYEWADAPPIQLTYKEAAARLGYSEMTTRVKMSHAGGAGFVSWMNGRPRVLMRTDDPEELDKVLNLAHSETLNTDDLVELPKRSGTSTRPKRF